MYPSHQWPPQGPVYDYPSPAPTGRANKIVLIVGIVLVVILGWAVFLGVVFSSSGPSPTHTASTPRVNPEDDTFLQKLDRMLGTPWNPHPASADRAQHSGSASAIRCVPRSATAGPLSRLNGWYSRKPDMVRPRTPATWSSSVSVSTPTAHGRVDMSPVAVTVMTTKARTAGRIARIAAEQS